MNNHIILASGGLGYGDNNLFNPAYTQGDLSKIRPIVNVVQTISVWVISIIGLAITISTIIKQAVHGLYATNPQFWDKVDEIHRQKLGATVDRGGNQVQMILGFGLSFAFSLFPNIKAITEFDGDTVDPKTFFTKSLPMACLYLFIGVFIFYGYTTKFGEKASIFGTELLDNFFLQVDPIAWAEKIPTSFAKINLSTSGSKSEFDGQVNDITKKAYGALKTDLGDITKEKQPRVALEVESWVISCLEEVRQYTDEDNWKMQFNARTTPMISDLTKVHNGRNEAGTEFTFAWQKPVSEFNTGTASVNAATDYLRIDVTYTKKASKQNTTSVEATMYGGTYSSGTKEGVIELGTSNVEAQLTGNGVRGAVNGVAVEISINGSKLTIKPLKSSEKLPDKVSEITDITNMYYVFGSGTHPIKAISISGDQGNGITFKPTNTSSSINSWSWGEGPTNKSGTDNGNSDEGDDDEDDDNNAPTEKAKDPNDIFSDN